MNKVSKIIILSSVLLSAYSNNIINYVNQNYKLSKNSCINYQENQPNNLKAPISYTINYLELEVRRKVNTTYEVWIRNSNSFPIHVCYNSKMCFEGDASKFNGLKHIEEIDIDSYSNECVEISENGTAGYITAAISYSDGITGYRYITYANGLKYDKSKNIGRINPMKNTIQTQRLNFSNLDTTIDGFPYYLKLSVIGRTWKLFSGYSYTIRIQNIFYKKVDVSYNTKMCFEWDADDFDVSNEEKIKINENSYKDVTIKSNGTAGYITASINFSSYGFDRRRITYANNLEENRIGTNKHSYVWCLKEGAYKDE